jgi:hypothetical protein
VRILQSLNLRPRRLEIVSALRGRPRLMSYRLAEEVTAGPDGLAVPFGGRCHGMRGQRAG